VSVNTEKHKVVVMIRDFHCGFTSLSKAISFIEEQVNDDDYSKTFAELAQAMSAGSNEDVDLRIVDIDSYIDVYLDDEDDEDGE